MHNIHYELHPMLEGHVTAEQVRHIVTTRATNEFRAVSAVVVLKTSWMVLDRAFEEGISGASRLGNRRLAANLTVLHEGTHLLWLISNRGESAYERCIYPILAKVTPADAYDRVAAVRRQFQLPEQILSRKKDGLIRIIEDHAQALDDLAGQPVQRAFTVVDAMCDCAFAHIKRQTDAALDFCHRVAA